MLTDDPNFRDLVSFCMFVGYPRSGHSLLGSLLDAHPEMMIAHEADVIGMVADGMSIEAIGRKLVERSQEQADAGRRQGDYGYEVPGQHQGRCDTLRVLGDKKGGGTALWLGRDMAYADKLIAMLDTVPLRLVHVIRNPFDNIATMTMRSQKALDQSVERYLERVETIATLKQRLPTEVILDVRMESLVAEPRDVLARICRFVDVGCTDDYLGACASIVFDKPNVTRGKVEWSDTALARVNDAIDRIAFLDGYAFDERPVGGD